MKLYLLTSNTHMESVDEFPNFEIIGVFDSLEKVQEVKQSYALELTSSILDIPISEKDYLLKQDEYKATADILFIDEVELNREYRNKKLEYELIG
ncbi:hypothetical protein [Enterococcus faecium]|uniref:hypothetical protein n=1 Tax=Enterococcus faecium TaxID=1352 RepID=UPI0003540B6A|nr:hypothetical protein [Enterococcus faecium]EPI25476.1 hypothetical protein D352_00351 [Enterococcus faecium LA4B-2]